MQLFIDRSQPVPGAADQPVGHGLPRKLDALPVPFLLLSVERGTHHEFLHCNMGHCFRRGISPWNHRWFLRCVEDRRGDILFLTPAASIREVHILPQICPGRLQNQRFTDLPADDCHLLSALGAGTLLLAEFMLHDFYGDILGKDISRVAGSFPGVRTYLDSCGFRLGFIFPLRCFGGIDLRLVKEKAQLFVHLFRRFLRRGAELPSPYKAELFQKPLVLRFQVLIFRTGNGHSFRVACQ